MLTETKLRILDLYILIKTCFIILLPNYMKLTRVQLNKDRKIKNENAMQ